MKDKNRVEGGAFCENQQAEIDRIAGAPSRCDCFKPLFLEMMN
ncbi:MAG: hypothetical protein BMS9Abin25_1530 [Gammaproteobacteria bacterium]|nr:MAG: hypothetical protein BMS9Abin25_1530 [Gammaproteobacteria bacterium]